MSDSKQVKNQKRVQSQVILATNTIVRLRKFVRLANKVRKLVDKLHRSTDLHNQKTETQQKQVNEFEWSETSSNLSTSEQQQVTTQEIAPANHAYPIIPPNFAHDPSLSTIFTLTFLIRVIRNLRDRPSSDKK
ncbi:hypothetical protein [Pseudanabaena sp. Chao 1811]|uniref:hypothetical protein n=1 Tax=Pseudanabaena sp. Chao 1811 TaxID=2963092 RepID=UPI0022F384C5|nr:hypothetical protein [Pseudanabaena sp. Chao 1811]